MEIHATIVQKVEIDPKEVIKKLIEKEIGERACVFEKNGKFYHGFEVDAGSHSFSDEIEISQEKYDYVIALELVLYRLNTKKF